MLNKIKDSVSIGFGKKEAAKTTKGVAIGGVGAVAYSVISDIGYTWQTFKDIERDLKILSDTCPNCKSPYEKNPCECGVYEGNNEPRIEPG